MPNVQDVCDFLGEFAPLSLAEEWDNVGLLWGDTDAKVERAMTCLTLTPDVADEAINENVNLIITHHPILFRPVQRITTGTSEGRMLWQLARHNIAVYSPHTAFDSASAGINQQLAEKLQLTDIKPLRPIEDDPTIGSGRYGMLKAPTTLEAFLQSISTALNTSHFEVVGGRDREIKQVAVACGSAAEFMKDADQLNCDVLVTGEARFHAALEARTRDIAMVLLGHYASERFACEALVNAIGEALGSIDLFASQLECDPLRKVHTG